MNRRDFLKTSGTATGLVAIAASDLNLPFKVRMEDELAEKPEDLIRVPVSVSTRVMCITSEQEWRTVIDYGLFEAMNEAKRREWTAWEKEVAQVRIPSYDAIRFEVILRRKSSAFRWIQKLCGVRASQQGKA